MKLAVVIIGALVATAFAAHKEEPTIQMPDLNKLNNLAGGKIPEIPPGMKIDDLKDAFYNMPPEMKDRLNEMAQSEKPVVGGAPVGGDAPAPGLDINNLLQGVDKGAMGEMLKGMDVNAMLKNMDIGPMGEMLKGIDVNSLMKNMDMGAMTDMMKNVDIQGMMQNMDLGAMGDIMKNVDVKGLMENMDMGAMGDIMKNVDVGGIMKNMDLGPMGDIVKNVDIGGLMKNMDLGAMGDIVKNVDVEGIMKNMDLGPMGDIMKNVDVKGLMQNMDMGAVADVMKNVDIGGIMKNMDLGSMGNILKNLDIGSMMKNLDLGAMGGMLKGMDMGKMMKMAGPMMAMMGGSDMAPIMDMMKHIDMRAIGGMLKGLDLGGIMGLLKEKPIDLNRLIDLKDMAWEYMENKGVPMDDPMAFMQFLHDKVKSLPLPKDMDLTPVFNMLHGQLEAMGFPEDKAEIKDWIMKMAGLEDIKDIEELKDPEMIAKVMMKKAFRMLDIDENEDPMVVKERIHDQLLEEAEKLGAKLDKDMSPEDLMREMDKVLTQHLNEMLGMESDSVMPGHLHSAIMNKLANLGIPVHDFGALKKHVMDMAMKQLMKSVTPMIMNFFMGGRQQPPPPPPMMMQPPMMMPPHPIDLDISVNVQNQMPPMMPYPGYLRGAEPALGHERLDDMSDEEMFHHIMAVRHGLATGEMPEEILQEMIEDLMNARLKNRVLAVRNMFLNDRIAAMEREMEMMRGPEMMAVPIMPEEMPMRPPTPRRAPLPRRADRRQGNPLLRALLKPRVL